MPATGSCSGAYSTIATGPAEVNNDLVSIVANGNARTVSINGVSKMTATGTLPSGRVQEGPVSR
ncbi:hypothetical protein ARTHROSP310_03210 [Arthrobacter sp. AD-310]